MVKIADGVPVIVECGPEQGFKISAQALEDAITERTRWLILNSPGNPSGAVYSASELAGLAEVLRRHPEISVISDDIYEAIIFDGHEFATMASVAPDLIDRILTVNGVSKSFAMTGWRIGYAGGPADSDRSDDETAGPVDDKSVVDRSGRGNWPRWRDLRIFSPFG